MEQLRKTILNAVDTLLNKPEHANNALAVVNRLYQDFIRDRQNAFSVERVVYGSFLHELLDSDVQRERICLQIIQDQLLGIQPYIHTYALKYRFIDLLEGESLVAYNELVRLFDMFIQKIHNPGQEEPADYEDLREILYLRYQQIHAKTVPELLVIQACHILLSLPDNTKTFDAMEFFSGIYPTPSMVVTVDSQLDYVRGFLNKLLGEEVLFVDVHLLPNENFMINLR
jgi:hypothetical protein